VMSEGGECRMSKRVKRVWVWLMLVNVVCQVSSPKVLGENVRVNKSSAKLVVKV
jgi:hypothetical protein